MAATTRTKNLVDLFELSVGGKRFPTIGAAVNAAQRWAEIDDRARTIYVYPLGVKNAAVARVERNPDDGTVTTFLNGKGV